MDCPQCGATRAKAYVTTPADKRADGRVARKRRCKECNKSFLTLELLIVDVKALETQATSGELGASIGPLSTAPAAPLIDIEAKLEGLLEPAIDRLEKTISGSAPDKTSAETARWLIADRREYRRSLDAAKESEEEEDAPGLQDLALVLKAVPS